MKKVLVTGGCGFIGSWCCEYYARKNVRVVSYDNMTKHELLRTGYNTELARTYNETYLRSLGVTLITEDVRNRQAVLDHAAGCDFIIHTAAQPAMTIATEDPDLDFSTNVAGTLNVLEAARRHAVPMVSCATIHVYGNTINGEVSEGVSRYERTPALLSETYPVLGGTLTPLHASKAAADSYVKVYADTFGVKAASFRLTGLYGPRQLGGEDHGWVANFAIRAIKGMPLRVYGTGKQLRDILYAADLVEAFDAFYRHPVPGIYNVGGGALTMISLKECIDLIGDILGTRPAVEYHPGRFGDLIYFACDISKITGSTGWRPMVTPRQGVESLIAWIRENKNLFGG